MDRQGANTKSASVRPCLSIPSAGASSAEHYGGWRHLRGFERRAQWYLAVSTGLRTPDTTVLGGQCFAVSKHRSHENPYSLARALTARLRATSTSVSVIDEST